MIGHLLFPNIDPIHPATLSKKLVNDLLRIELKFDGLVVSDALVMKAISNTYSSGQAALMAFNAGIDLILMPEDIDEAIDTLTEAFFSGKIPLERLKRSRYRRQKQLDLISNQIDLDKKDFKFKSCENEFLLQSSIFSQDIIKKSIFLRKTIIKKVDFSDVNLLQVDNFDQVSTKSLPALSLPKRVGFKNIIIHPLGLSPWKKNNNKLLELEKIGNGKILIQLFVRGKPFLGNNYDNQNWVNAIKNLDDINKLSGVVVYGCPYLFNKIKESVNNYIPLAYSPSQTEEAQNQILLSLLDPKLFLNKKDHESSKEFT